MKVAKPTKSKDKNVSFKLGFVMAPGQKGSIINPIPGVAGAGSFWTCGRAFPVGPKKNKSSQNTMILSVISRVFGFAPARFGSDLGNSCRGVFFYKSKNSRHFEKNA